MSKIERYVCMYITDIINSNDNTANGNDSNWTVVVVTDTVLCIRNDRTNCCQSGSLCVSSLCVITQCSMIVRVYYHYYTLSLSMGGDDGNNGLGLSVLILLFIER